MRKLTHEQFMERFYKKNKHAQNIEVLGTYVNTNTKILCKCKVCEHEWAPTAGSLLNGKGCPECSGKIKPTHEQFMKNFYKKNKHAQDIEILGIYKNNHTKIKCKCKIDEHQWEATPNNLLNGSGCPKCAGKIKPTTEEFINELQQINPNIKVLGTYINSQTKILCKCKIDGYEWEALPNHLLNGHGCPKCGIKRASGNNTKTHEQFMQNLYEKNIQAQNIEIIGTYIKDSVKIKCRCKICDHEWTVRPNSLLHGCGCPKCGKKRAAQKQSKTHEQFIIELHQINPDIEILGHYKNNKTKIKCRCKKCGHEWSTKPDDLLKEHGCPKCNISRGEKRIAQYLDNLGIDYIYNMCYFKDLVGTGGGLLRPDFIIPSLKIWIEYDGMQHSKPVNFRGAMSEQQLHYRFKYTQQNDQIKNQYAKDNNWTLIRIPFTEYDNIEQILAEYIEQEEQVI